MRIAFYFVVVILIGAWTGCTKMEETTYHGKMWNGNAEALTVDFYRTIDDYHNVENMLERVVVPSNGEAEIPNELESGVN